MYSTLVMETVVEKYVKFFKSTFHRNNHYFAKYVCCEILNFLMLFFKFYLTNVFLNGNFWNYGWELLEFNKYSLWEQKVSNFFCTFNFTINFQISRVKSLSCAPPAPPLLPTFLNISVNFFSKSLIFGICFFVGFSYHNLLKIQV